jgi:cobalt-zinc-cadmium efflux system outer membrane protein
MPRGCAARALAAAIAFAAGPALAQPPAPPVASITSLKQAFEVAWTRQPEGRAAAERRAADQARRAAATSWFAQPPSVELAAKTGRFTRDEGAREYEAGVAMPLWLPGERARTGALVDGEAAATESRLLAAQLRVAASLRGAYWAVERARVERDIASVRLTNAEQLARDVARRVGAGDLSRADRHQADIAVAIAEGSLAEADSALAHAGHELQNVLGTTITVAAAPEPVPTAPFDESRHGALKALADRAEVARLAGALAGVQTRANPDLIVAATRERGAFGEPYGQTVTMGVRIPFGSDSRARARRATAAADAIEADTNLMLERDHVLGAIHGAQGRLASTVRMRAAAERRAQLAAETRGFFEKSFRLGETDLPTRLRVELEAFEAERALARVRVEHALAISHLRQALGLLPE